VNDARTVLHGHEIVDDDPPRRRRCIRSGWEVKKVEWTLIGATDKVGRGQSFNDGDVRSEQSVDP
jgi:hypothetical protein